jgi:23S rRNA G2445 N2-methylase RlmL
LAYALCPEILNDPSRAPWTIAVHPAEDGATAELVPHLTPDPRLYYRVGDVPAASHPPLAACMARMAGPLCDAVIWDPFCGSGLELIERALLGGVRQVHGTDLSPGALAISRRNFDAAKLPGVQAQFTQADFRDFARIPGLGPETVDLVISNPPMGRRIRIPDLHGLIADMMAVAATVLKPGGQLIFPNPVTINVPPRGLRKVSGQWVDLGGFDCLLEHHQKRA